MQSQLAAYSAATRIGITGRPKCSVRSGCSMNASMVSSLRTRNHSAYSAGTTSSVNAVATNRPPMMVMAIGPQKMLPASGIMPRMAARAVRTTGRARRTVAPMIARAEGEDAKPAKKAKKAKKEKKEGAEEKKGEEKKE